MSEYTVSVVGATGKTGRLVAAGALSRGWKVRSATRRAPAQGEWARFSWDERDTWATAFEGSDAAYVLIPFNHPGAPESTPELIRAIGSAGVRRIVLLSSIDAEHADEGNPLTQSESAVANLPVQFAILRPTWFLDNFTTGSFAAMTESGQLRLPAGEGRIPFVDTRDIADVAVAALAADGPQGVLPLTGPASITHHELAEAFSTAFGRRVTYTPVPITEFNALMTARGFSEEYAQFLAEALAEVANGTFTVPVWDTVERICGRPAYSAVEFARHVASRDQPAT